MCDPSVLSYTKSSQNAQIDVALRRRPGPEVGHLIVLKGAGGKEVPCALFSGCWSRGGVSRLTSMTAPAGLMLTPGNTSSPPLCA